MERHPKVECCLASQSRPRNRDRKVFCGAVRRGFFKSFFFFGVARVFHEVLHDSLLCNRKRVGLFLSAVQNSFFLSLLLPFSVLPLAAGKCARDRRHMVPKTTESDTAIAVARQDGQRAHTEPMSAMMWTVSVCTCVLCVFVSLWVCVSVCVVCEVCVV